MTGFRVAIILLLLSSIGLNGVLLVRALGASAPPADGPSIAPAPAKPAAPGPAAGRCEAALRRCETGGWRMVARIIDQQRKPARPVRSGAAPEPPKKEDAAARWRKKQRDFRCRMAAEHLKLQWRAKQKALMAVVRRDLADKVKMEQKLKDEVRRFSSSMGLSPAEEDLLLDRYRPVRARHLGQLANVLSRPPVDYKKAMRIFKGLYAAEDRLVGGIFGPKARSKLRQTTLQPRTAILTIAATFAGVDWNDESVSW